MDREVRRAPKRKRIGIKWKLFFILFAFVSLFAFIIWICQIQMLHYFYQGAKFNELSKTSEELIANFEDENALIEIGQTSAKEHLNDIWIYSTSAKKFETQNKIAFFEGMRDDLGYYLESNFPSLYEKAIANDGKYIAMVPMSSFKDSYFDFKIIKDNDGDPDSFPYVSGNIQRLNVISCEIVEFDTENVIIIQRSSITPLGAMIDALENQTFLIAILLIVLTLILAAIIAKLITKPLERINQSAKSLAVGAYDTEFHGSGYREIEELSDTLNYAARELSLNDRLQKELISNVSHDIRTPLTMIKGYSEVMRDIPDENTPENIQVIIDETERLSNLVSDMLDLSKLQAGSRKADMREFSLTEMVRSTMSRYEKLIRQEGYQIEFSADKDVCVIADGTMILQVIYNLINNAVNYTGDDKKVTVLQSCIGDCVRISISDTGEGISQDDIPFIWDRYYRLDKVHKRATVGTGLGLSIVKEVLELHNATYGVTSIIGKGSTFWFELKTADSDEYKAEIVEI